ncbi:MAG: DUF4440 domain-containing protein [Euryhalocaulis sp.]|uniref:DUF4440 domain-containing protein n=1 Tax=Euryhalocaulis sp. TaxID=2744307 RepID=UPI0017D27B66|nr:DUF4440 domain-containing protein [Euryhalocaulis sp.]MBA4801025.1 DUF4440 domain-containing protein [Euryhalocaulis sp.]
MTDEEQIRAAVTEMYAMVSGPAGPRDWSKQNEVFHPDSRQIRTGIGEDGRMWAQAFDRDAYRENVEPFFEKTAFYEIELGSEVRIFGNIAHVWSAYEARTALDDETPERRGINSIQLLKDPDGKWRIISMIWDNEREGLSLPAIGD